MKEFYNEKNIYVDKIIVLFKLIGEQPRIVIDIFIIYRSGWQ